MSDFVSENYDENYPPSRMKKRDQKRMKRPENKEVDELILQVPPMDVTKH